MTQQRVKLRHDIKAKLCECVALVKLRISLLKQLAVLSCKLLPTQRPLHHSWLDSSSSLPPTIIILFLPYKSYRLLNLSLIFLSVDLRLFSCQCLYLSSETIQLTPFFSPSGLFDSCSSIVCLLYQLRELGFMFFSFFLF